MSQNSKKEKTLVYYNLDTYQEQPVALGPFCTPIQITDVHSGIEEGIKMLKSEHIYMAPVGWDGSTKPGGD